MTALAAIVNWNGEPLLPSTLHRFAHSALLPPNTQLALSTHLAGPSVLSSGHVQLAADSPNPASILEAYLRHGVDLWNHLDIQYSFVLWDAATEILLAARDPFGTRPLHYAHTRHGICLASQPKQFLLAGLVPLELDDEAALLFLAISIVSPRRTFFKNIHAIPPGHALLATRHATKVFRHWFTQPPPPTALCRPGTISRSPRPVPPPHPPHRYTHPVRIERRSRFLLPPRQRRHPPCQRRLHRPDPCLLPPLPAAGIG